VHLNDIKHSSQNLPSKSVGHEFRRQLHVLKLISVSKLLHHSFLGLNHLGLSDQKRFQKFKSSKFPHTQRPDIDASLGFLVVTIIGLQDQKYMVDNISKRLLDDP
jgi:hypothetical protein